MRADRLFLVWPGLLVLGVVAVAVVIAVWSTRGGPAAVSVRAPLRAEATIRASIPSLPAPSHTAPPPTMAAPTPFALPPGLTPVQIIRDPLDPDYDSAKFYNYVRGSPIDFFAKEPRDKDWAPQREKDIEDMTLPAFHDADPDAKIEVECHTGSCRVTVHSRNKYLTSELGNFPLTCLANTTVPAWGPGSYDDDGPDVVDPRSDFYMFFGAETRGREGMLKTIQVAPNTGEPGACVRYVGEWRKRVHGGKE